MSEINPIYLDYNATTPILPEVIDAMLPYLTEHFGNPSSSHVYGQRTHKAVEQAREQVAALMGCEADEIIFTSGGTEANNLAIRGATEAQRDSLLPIQTKAAPRNHVVTSTIEHPATTKPVNWLERQGFNISRLGVDPEGRIVPGIAEKEIHTGTVLVTIMHSNNETGVLQPIRELTQLAHRSGAIMHTDAAQSIGKVSVDVKVLGVDLLSIAGHKLYAPKGVGALYIRRGTPLAPFTLGAGHERGLRPGTENVAYIVGLGVACAIARRDLTVSSAQIQALRDLLWQKLYAAIPGIAINGHRQERLPNTLNVRFPKVSGNALLAATPEIAASTGSACHSHGESASSVILAMGMSPADALGSVRLTLGRQSTETEIENSANALIKSWRRLVSV